MMFDVDCPNTPDGNSPKIKQPVRPPSVARRIANSRINSSSNNNNKYIAPRIRSSNSYDRYQRPSRSYEVNDGNVGLEPEEMILPSSSNNTNNTNNDSAAANNNGSMYRAAPSNNPFDDDSVNMTQMRRRTHSDSWWKEEIVQERADKTDLLEGYYGLSRQDKQEFYGKTNNNPFEQDKAAAGKEGPINRHGHTSFHVTKTGHVAVGIGIDRDGSVESALVTEAVTTPKQHGSRKSYHYGTSNDNANYNSQNSPPVNPSTARKTAHAVMQRADARGSAGGGGGHYNTAAYNDDGNDMTQMSLYDQAASIRNNGHYHVDDYSFSTIKIHSPKEDAGSPKRGYSTKNNNNGKSLSILKMPKWMQGFALTKGYTPGEYGADPNITKETNIAPPIRGSEYQDHWTSSSPKVTFDTRGHYNDDDEKCSRWSSLSDAQRIGAGVIWVALMCVLMGVTIWSLNKPQQSVYGENASSAQGLIGAAMNTGAPTSDPTPRPTRPPTSLSPVAGYSSLHGKASNSTPRPTRMPVTSRPSNSPVVSPTLSPSSSPTQSPTSLPTPPMVELVQGVPATCTDDQGYFLNHLMNPKDCAWLYNDKDGYTDRKDKNCGTALYPRTDLGSACRATCGIYNGCTTSTGGQMPAVANTPSDNYSGISFMSEAAAIAGYLVPSETKSKQSEIDPACLDVNGRTFKNHLGSDKTCEWLDNDKPGQTERKDKNCGFGSYPITELGINCPQTCIWYNGSGCSTSMIKKRSIDPSSNLRKVDTTRSSTDCVNGSGKYEDHHGDRKQCQWLHEPDKPNVEKFRQDKNCGTEENPITELGMKCPWSCKEYNGCDELRN